LDTKIKFPKFEGDHAMGINKFGDSRTPKTNSLRAVARFAGLAPLIDSVPGVRFAHPGLYAAVRFADC